MREEKLADLAEQLEKRNAPPKDWYRLGTITELLAISQHDRENPEHVAQIEEIRLRCLERHRLGLFKPGANGRRDSCAGGRKSASCSCAEQALEELSSSELATLTPSAARKRVRKLARPHHIPPRRWHQTALRPKPKAASAAASPQHEAVTSPRLPALSDTPTRPARVLWRQGTRRAAETVGNPIVWLSQQSRRPRGTSILDKQF